jgi:hypothetical protein
MPYKRFVARGRGRVLQGGPAAPGMAYRLSDRNGARLVLFILGASLMLGAFTAPWWTRGIAFEHDCIYDEAKARSSECRTTGSPTFAFDGLIGLGQEGVFLNYGVFSVPGANGVTTDASRETAVTILGIGAVLCAAFALAGILLRFLVHLGKVEAGADLPTRLAILGFVAGLFTVLWGALFLPLLGSGPGMLWGREYNGTLFDSLKFLSDTRYANAGFYFGIAGFVLFPAWLWLDAHRARAASTWGAVAGTEAASTPAAA